MHPMLRVRDRPKRTASSHAEPPGEHACEWLRRGTAQAALADPCCPRGWAPQHPGERLLNFLGKPGRHRVGRAFIAEGHLIHGQVDSHRPGHRIRDRRGRRTRNRRGYRTPDRAGRRRTGYRAGRRTSRLDSDRAAIAAFHLAETPDQADARAERAPVEVGDPSAVYLAAWADQHLAVSPDAAQPRAAAAVRVDLPGATAIA